MTEGRSRRRFIQELGMCGVSLGLFDSRLSMSGLQAKAGLLARSDDRPSPFPGPPISPAVFTERLARIRAQMRQRDLSCLLVSSVMNHAVRYLGFFDPDLQGRPTGAPQLATVFLPLEGNPVLFLQTFTSADYLLPRARAASLVEDVRLVGGTNEDVLKGIVKHLRGLKLTASKVGLAGGEIEWAVKLYLTQALPNVRAEDANVWLDRLRIVKAAEEIELLRRSAAIGDAGIHAVQKALRPNLSDFDLYAIAEQEMRRLGADEDTFILMGMGPSHNPMLMEGLSGRKVRSSSVIVFEVLPYYRHYNTELAVTFAVGKVGEKQRKAAKACEAAYQAGVAEVRPGAPVAKMSEAALKVFRQHGFDSFTHTSGHFIGLDNYEGPPLRKAEVLFEAGMVLSFHPNVVVPNEVKEQVCGLLLVTEKEVENLSSIKPVGMHPVG